MDQHEKELLRHKRNRLVNLKDEIARQEELLKSARSRAENWQGADESVMKVLRQFFSELSEALPEKNIKFNDNNSIDGLLAQLSSAYSKVRVPEDVPHLLLELATAHPVSAAGIIRRIDCADAG